MRKTHGWHHKPKNDPSNLTKTFSTPFDQTELGVRQKSKNKKNYLDNLTSTSTMSVHKDEINIEKRPVCIQKRTLYLQKSTKLS